MKIFTKSLKIGLGLVLMGPATALACSEDGRCTTLSSRAKLSPEVQRAQIEFQANSAHSALRALSALYFEVLPFSEKTSPAEAFDKTKACYQVGLAQASLEYVFELEEANESSSADFKKHLYFAKTQFRRLSEYCGIRYTQIGVEPVRDGDFQDLKQTLFNLKDSVLTIRSILEKSLASAE